MDIAVTQTSALSPLIPTVFHEEWWLAIATKGRYKIAEVSSGGAVVGRLPYYLTHRFGLAWSGMPNLTHFLGPAVDEGTGGIGSRFVRRMEITRELIRQLPKTEYMQIKCHRSVPDVICFQEQKFRTTVQFTYEIHPALEETLWKALRDKTRNVIRRAQERFTVSELYDAGEFFAFYKKNLKEKSIHNYLDLEMCQKLIEACLARHVGRIYAARDRNGALAAAIFCVWDTTSCFYLMSTRSAAAGNGGVSLLIWEAIKDATLRGLIFDFDGLYNVGGILLYSGFGGIASPRYVATKMTLPWWIGNTLLRSSAEHKWFI